jgi:glyoxylase-like metal-dependent hydrolase (beta-lactamase superfamily II)
MTSTAQTPSGADDRRPLSRRTLIAAAGLTAAAVPAAALLGAAPAAAAATAAPAATSTPAATGADCPPTATAPVPPFAQGPAIPKSGYLVGEIGERTYWVTDGLYQMIFLVTGEGVVAVDAPPTIGNNILRAIASVTKSPVTHAIYSHHHADHTGAMVLYQGARFYAQNEVAGLLRQTGDPNRPLPQVTFDDRLTVAAGQDRIELAYHGPNHSPGNIFAYLPAQRVLMLVDVVFPGWVPFAYLAESQNIPGWLGAPAQALGYPFHTFIGGHLTRLGTRDDVVIQQEYVAELKAAAANAIDTFNVGTVYASVDDTNPWAIFRGYLDGVAAQAAGAVVPRWTGKLGGADVYTQANAYQLVESLRIDYGHLGPFGIHP